MLQRPLWRVLPVVLLACAGAAVVPHPGVACAQNDTATCDPDNHQFLECQANTYVAVADCHGPAGCAVVNDVASCDTSGDSLGDRCPPSSEGKVRCDPDGGHLILRCIDGGLSSIFECPTSTRCAIEDAGLSCY
jgi:hypothetical protein